MEFCQLVSTNPTLSRTITIQSVGLLAYSSLAMGLPSGKYMSTDGGSKDARPYLYKGRYTEAEFNLNNFGMTTLRDLSTLIGDRFSCLGSSVSKNIKFPAII